MANQPDVLTKEAAAPIVADMVKQVLKEREDAAELATIKAKAAKADELEAENTALKAQKPPEQPAKRLPGHEDSPEQELFADPEVRRDGLKTIPVITVGSKFDSASAVDMAYGLTILRGLRDSNQNPLKISESYIKALVEKTYTEGYRVIGTDGKAIKANELMHSTLANYGDEWVPDLWSSELWRKARIENMILPMFRSIEMPSNPFELPIEGTDPTVYFVPETTYEQQWLLSCAGTVIPYSQVGSGKVTLAAKKLAIRVGFSAELAEDAVIPLLALYREQGLRVMMDAIDHVLLNGDTEAGGTGNINSDDGAPAATAKYMAFNGLRKLGLVTTTANKLDAAGAPTASLFRQTRFLMSSKYALQPTQCVYIVDGGTYGKALEANELITVDKYGQSATIITGELGKVYGVPVVASAEMPLTEADGKASATPSNNTKGQALCVYRPGWVVGYRRRIAATMTYIPYFDAYQLVATVRLAFINFDGEVASVLYNITV